MSNTSKLMGNAMAFGLILGAALGAGGMYALMQPSTEIIRAVPNAMVWGYGFTTPSPNCSKDWAPITKIVPCQEVFITPARLTMFEGHLAVYGPCQEDPTHGITCSYLMIADGSDHQA